MTTIEESEFETKCIDDDKIVTNGDVKKETTSEEDEWQDLLGSGGIMKKILINGKSDSKPLESEKCVVNYRLLLEDESVVEAEENFEFILGERDVVHGLDIAISLMNLEEKCKLKLEPRFAFGSQGLPPKVPKDATVIYEIELIDVKPPNDVDVMTLAERKLMGNKKRERGNWWYERGDNQTAIQCYRKALDYLDSVEGNIGKEATDAELQSLLENRVNVYNNMGAAQIRMELYDAALESIQKVLRFQPNNVKALFRKAKVYSAKLDLTAAMKCLQKANELSPNDIAIQKEINAVTQLIQKHKVSERNMARRMFSSGSNSDKKTTHCQKRPFRLWAVLGATVAVGVASVLAYRFKFA